MPYDPNLPVFGDALSSAPRDSAGAILASNALQAYGSLRYGLPALVERAAGTLSPDDEKYYAAWNVYEQQKAQAMAPTGAASVGDLFGGKVGLPRFLLENTAAMAPHIAGMVAGGAIGSLVGPEGTVAGGLEGLTPGVIGSFLGGLPQAAAGNASRELQETGHITADQAGRDLLAAPVESALNVAGGGFIPGLGKILGPIAAKFEGNVLSRTLKSAAAGAATMATAATGQAAAERWAAGDPMTSGDALREYVQSFGTGAVLGGAMGGAVGPFRKAIQEKPANQVGNTDMTNAVDEAIKPTLALPAPTMNVDAAGRAGLGTEGAAALMAEPRVAEPPPETPLLTYRPDSPAGPDQTTPGGSILAATSELRDQPTSRLNAVLERTNDPHIAGIIEQELASRNRGAAAIPTAEAVEQGGAPASAPTFEDLTKGIRVNQDLKKLAGASPEELHAGVTKLLEDGDARKGTLDLAERLGIDTKAPAAPVEVPDAALQTFTKLPTDAQDAQLALMHPTDRAALEQQTYAALRGRDLTEAEKAGSKEVVTPPTAVENAAVKLGLLDKKGDYTDKFLDVARSAPVSLEEATSAAQAAGYEGKLAAAFTDGAAGRNPGKLDDFAEMGPYLKAYEAGQKWKVPDIKSADETSSVTGELGTKSEVGEPVRELTDDQKTQQALSERIDTLAEPQKVQTTVGTTEMRPGAPVDDVAGLKAMLIRGEKPADIAAAIDRVEQGEHVFQQPEAAPHADFVGAVPDRIAVNPRMTPEGRAALQQDIAGAKRESAVARTDAQAVKQFQSLVAGRKVQHASEHAALRQQIDAAVAAGDITPKDRIIALSKLANNDFAGASDVLTGDPVLRHEMNVGRRDFLAGVAATAATTTIDAAHAKIAPLVRTAPAAELAGQLRNGNIPGALQHIRDNSSDPMYRTIAGKLLRGGGWDKVTLGLADDQGPLYGTTTLNDDGSSSIQLYGKHGLDEETALHEMIHAFVQQRWGALSLYTEHNEAMVHASADRADATIRDFQKLWDKIGDVLKATNPEMVDHEAWAANFAATPDEALAWLMTNKQAQAYLKSVDENGAKIGDAGNTLWDRFARWVAGVLGLNYNPRVRTALDSLLDAGHAILDKGKDVRTGDFNTKIAGEIARESGRMELNVKPPRTVAETDETTKRVVPDILAAASKIPIQDAKGKVLKFALGAAPMYHMAELYGHQLDGIRDIDKIDRARLSTKSLLSQLHNVVYQRTVQAGAKATEWVNTAMRLTEFGADATRLWADQPWLHDLPNAAEIKAELARGNSVYNNLKSADLAHLYDDRRALNETALQMELATKLHNLIQANPEYQAGTPGLGDPTKAFREDSKANATPASARAYWADQVQQHLKAAEDYVSTLRGDMTDKTKAQQGRIETHLNPLEARIQETQAGLARLKQAPYFTLGRHGDQFSALTLKNDKGVASKATILAARAEIAKAGFDDVYISPATDQSKVYVRFKTEDARQQFESTVIAALRAKNLVDPDVEIIGGPREGTGVYHPIPLKDAGLEEVIRGVNARFSSEGMAPADAARMDALRETIVNGMRDDWVSSHSDNSLVKVWAQRENRPGYSADMTRSFAKRFEMSAVAQANLAASPQMFEALAKMNASVREARRIDSVNHPDVQKLFDVTNEVMRRQADRGRIEQMALFDKGRAMTNVYYLGLSPGHMVTRYSQLPMLTLPELGSRYGFAKSAQALFAAHAPALRVMAALAAEGKQLGWGHFADATITGKVLDRAGISQGEKAFITKLIASGEIDISSAARALSQVSQGSAEGTLGKMARFASVTAVYADLSTRLIAALAARTVNDGKRMSNEDYARYVIMNTIFDHSTANVPRFLGKGGPLGAGGQIATQFMQYSVHLMTKLYRETHEAISAASPEDRAEARKFLAAHATAVTALAGTLGLPFASAAATAVDKLVDTFSGTPGQPYNATASWRDFLASIFGTEMERILAHGVPTGAGVDLSGRIGEHDLLPFSEFISDRRGWRDAFEKQSMASFGAAGSMALNTVDGVGKMLDGNLLAGMTEAAPTFLKNFARGGQMMADGTYRDGNGNKLPLSAGAADIMYQLMGLTPADKALANEKASDARARTATLTRERGVLNNQIVNAVVEGKGDSLRGLLQQAREFDKGNPAYAILPGLEGAVKRRMQQNAMRQAGFVPGLKLRDVQGQQQLAY